MCEAGQNAKSSLRVNVSPLPLRTEVTRMSLTVSPGPRTEVAAIAQIGIECRTATFDRLPHGKQAQRGTMFCNVRAVASSAGKNDSIASSDTVTSTGVPNTVVVLKNDSLPPSVTSCNGTTTPPNLSGAAGARLIGVG